MKIEAKVDYKKLKKAVEAMSKEYIVKVGLLSDKGGSDSVSDNLDLAGLGAIHEFGATINVTDKMRAFFRHQFNINLKKSTTTIVIPPRSFLEMPIVKHSRKIQKNMISHFGGEGIESIEYWIATKGDLLTVAQMLGASAMEVIQESFETSGWGEWAPNSPMTIAQKGSALPLVDTGKLRSKITFEVQENK